MRKLCTLFLIPTLYLVLSALPLVRADEDYWTTLEPMPTARSGLGVAVVDGKIFAIGGFAGSYLTTNEVYDPVSNTWNKRTAMPTPRADFGIAVYKNKIYVLGGAIGVDPSGNGNTIISPKNEVYDPVTNTWETKAPLPTPRHGLTASVANGKIYLISGFQNSEVSYLLDYGSVKNEVYDPETNTWETKPPIPTGVFHAVSATVGDKIFVLGGNEASLGLFGPSSFNQVYDIKKETWTSASPVPVGFDAAAGGVTIGAYMPKKIYVFGGLDSSYEPCNLTQIYDPDQDVWINGTEMLSSHAFFGVANVNDEFYAIGGAPSNNANEKYTPADYDPEFPSWIVLPLFVTATLIVIIWRKKLCRRLIYL